MALDPQHLIISNNSMHHCITMYLEVILSRLSGLSIHPLIMDVNSSALLTRTHWARGWHLCGRVLVLVVAHRHGDGGEESVWRGESPGSWSCGAGLSQGRQETTKGIIYREIPVMKHRLTTCMQCYHSKATAVIRCFSYKVIIYLTCTEKYYE